MLNDITTSLSTSAVFVIYAGTQPADVSSATTAATSGKDAPRTSAASPPDKRSSSAGRSGSVAFSATSPSWTRSSVARALRICAS